jgi:predicted transcriptional regulator
MISRKVRLVLNSDKSVFRQLLEYWDINLSQFAAKLNISPKSFYNYHHGRSTFNMDLKQVKQLERMLQEVGLTFNDLPDDWMIDKIPMQILRNLPAKNPPRHPKSKLKKIQLPPIYKSA